MAMHIGLNLLFVIPGVVGGTETYASALVRALATLDRRNQYTLFVNDESRDVRWVDQANFTTVACAVRATSRARRYAYEQTVLPRLVRRHGVDVLHSLGYVSPLRLRCASVVTVHDLNYEAIPDSFTPLRRAVLQFFVPRGARRAETVLTLSEASRRRIVGRLGVPESRVVVTPCAADRPPASGDVDFVALGARLGIDRPYVLALSSGSPHKNLARLVRAFSRLETDQLQLVVAGYEPIRGESLRALADELRLGSSIRFTGYLSDPDLALIRRNARVFAFPSLYEGFGIPVLEAMEAGVPVVASNVASLPEVVGDAGRLVDPHSVDDIAAGLREVIADEGLRRDLVQRGYQQLRRFSWESTARRTLEVYEAAFERTRLAPGGRA
jgi:glycosyltransferase involved in cell wall biosynthesis